MFLKKKAHNLFAKSVKMALKNVRGSVTYVEAEKTEEPAEEEHEVAEEVIKSKKTSKGKKAINEELVEG